MNQLVLHRGVTIPGVLFFIIYLGFRQTYVDGAVRPITWVYLGALVLLLAMSVVTIVTRNKPVFSVTDALITHHEKKVSFPRDQVISFAVTPKWWGSEIRVQLKDGEEYVSALAGKWVSVKG